MRDFRDAKVMAHTLRAALVTKGLNITVSQSLELIAQAFGVADWNTLSAVIREETAGLHNNAAAPESPTTATIHRALAYARQRKDQYVTLEHLLLALIDDVDASAVMKACKVDLGGLKDKLTKYIDDDLKTLAIYDGGEPKHTAGFQRVVRQRAAHYAEERSSPNWTGAELLVAIFDERQSPATRLLGEQDMTRQDALNFNIHGVVK
ncbi:MAG: Clp protease N-terminal domain-containing protein [Xanthobacteraceae bacterium]